MAKKPVKPSVRGDIAREHGNKELGKIMDDHAAKHGENPADRKTHGGGGPGGPSKSVPDTMPTRNNPRKEDK